LYGRQFAENTFMEDQPAVDYPLPPGDDRRYPRYQIHLPVTVEGDEHQVQGTNRQAVLLHDISLTGCCFTSAHAYAIDSVVKIQIDLGTHPYQVNALVQRSEPALMALDVGHGIAVLFVRGGDIYTFIPALATYLNRRPHARLTDEPENSRMPARQAPFSL